MGTARIVEVEAARLRTSGNAFIPGAVHNPFDPIRLIFVKSFNAHLEWGRELCAGGRGLQLTSCPKVF